MVDHQVPNMPEIQRMTTEYVEAEDRIRISGECNLAAGDPPSSENNKVTVLWLTQRLLCRLIPHVCKHLENARTPNLQAEIQQSFAQEAALAALEPQAPVRIPSTSDAVALSYLIHEIDLTTTDNGLQLAFKDSRKIVVGKTTMAAQPLRQWLQITFAQFKRAHWPLSIWPDWMAEATHTRQGDQPQPTKLH